MASETKSYIYSFGQMQYLQNLIRQMQNLQKLIQTNAELTKIEYSYKILLKDPETCSSPITKDCSRSQFTSPWII